MANGTIFGKQLLIQASVKQFSIAIPLLLNRLKMVMGSYEHMPPIHRMKIISDFNQRILQFDHSERFLADWGLQLDESLIEINARVLPAQKLRFGDDIQRL